MKIVKTKYGLASRIDNEILISQDLDPKSLLYKALITHELNHTDNYNIKDLLIDVNIKELKNLKWHYWKFVVTHPKTWIMFSPLTKYKKHWTLDITLLMFWILAGFVSWILISATL